MSCRPHGRLWSRKALLSRGEIVEHRSLRFRGWVGGALREAQPGAPAETSGSAGLDSFSDLCVYLWRLPALTMDSVASRTAGDKEDIEHGPYDFPSGRTILQQWPQVLDEKVLGHLHPLIVERGTNQRRRVRPGGFSNLMVRTSHPARDSAEDRGLCKFETPGKVLGKRESCREDDGTKHSQRRTRPGPENGLRGVGLWSR